MSALVQINEGDTGISRIGQITPDDTFKQMIQKLYISKERKAYEIVENRVQRIVSETDIFAYFINERKFKI